MFGNPRHMLGGETSKPVNVGRTLSRLLNYIRPYWLALLLVVLLVGVSTYAQVLTPELTGQAVDCYLTPALAGAASGFSGQVPGVENSSAAANCWFDPAAATAEAGSAGLIAGLGRLILLITGLFVASSLLTGLTFYLMSWAGQHVLRELRSEIFRHLHRLSLTFYAQNEAGNIMSRITNDMETIQQVISFALVNVFSGLLLMIWIGYTMLSKNLVYALLSMAVVPLMAAVTVWFSGMARRAYRRTRKEIGRVNADLQESISGVREVQAFGREEANIETFRQTNAANRDANIQAVAYTSALSPALEALGYLALAVVVGVGGLALLRGQDLFGTAVSLGLVIAFLGFVQRFIQPVAQISVLWTNIQSAVAGAERIFGLLDEVPDVQDQPAAQPMPQIRGRVEFDQVDAAYLPGVPVLDKVSFTAEPGQTIAIVGPTGAGKTTIINLIPRFYDLTGGQIRIDGIDIASVQASSLRQQIGMVLQDTYLFSDTVMTNIRFGRPDATDEEVHAAARLAYADDFIHRLPQGYETVLGEHGAGLSQGQRQLIAIARAALASPRILILDEATSSVDTRTERLIQKALDELLRGRTSFVIAHRLSTIRSASLVLVLEDGRIVEQGTHTSLLAQKGAYHNLYMRQFRPEDDRLREEPSGLRPSPAVGD